MQEGFCALAAAKAAQAGATLERCVDAAVDTIGRTRYLFVPATLEYLKRGGRIGTASALLGTLLQIKPILTVRNGQTEVFARVRTQSRAFAAMASQFASDVSEYGLQRVVVHYISDRDAAVDFSAKYIEPLVGRAVEIVPVSPVVGLHVGPAVAVCYETERAIAG
jgi:DegV family protein with EDD domain